MKNNKQQLAELIETHADISFIVIPDTKRIFACRTREEFRVETDFLDYHGMQYMEAEKDGNLEPYSDYKIEV